MVMRARAPKRHAVPKAKNPPEQPSSRRYAILVPDEEEHEPEPFSSDAIISVDGRDVERCHVSADNMKRAA